MQIYLLATVRAPTDDHSIALVLTEQSVELVAICFVTDKHGLVGDRDRSCEFSGGKPPIQN
jgi:hypothetical protein